MKKFIRIDKDPEYFQIKEKIELPQYDRRLATKNIKELLKLPSIQPQAIRLYEQIFKLHEIMRGIKYSYYDLNIDHKNVERRQELLLEFAIQLLEPTIKQSDAMLAALGQDFLAYARKKCRRSLKLLESLLNEPSLVAVLNLDSDLLNEVVSENMKMLAYYQSIRAKE